MGRIRAERDTRAKPGLCQSPPALAGECFLNGMECRAFSPDSQMCCVWAGAGTQSLAVKLPGAGLWGWRHLLLEFKCAWPLPPATADSEKMDSNCPGGLIFSKLPTKGSHYLTRRVGTPYVSPNMTHKYFRHAPLFESVIPQIKYPKCLCLTGMKAITWKGWDDSLPDPETLVQPGWPRLCDWLLCS